MSKTDCTTELLSLSAFEGLPIIPVSRIRQHIPFESGKTEGPTRATLARYDCFAVLSNKSRATSRSKRALAATVELGDLVTTVPTIT